VRINWKAPLCKIVEGLYGSTELSIKRRCHHVISGRFDLNFAMEITKAVNISKELDGGNFSSSLVGAIFNKFRRIRVGA
jgi:hypothetical protein